MAYKPEDAIAYKPEHFGQYVRDRYEIFKHNLLVATESNSGFPRHADSEEEAKKELEFDIANHVFEAVEAAQRITPEGLKDVLPSMAKEPSFLRAGLNKFGIFSAKPESKTVGPKNDQAEPKNDSGYKPR